MSKYDFNINNAAVENLSPDKRYPNNITFLKSLLSSLQWLRDLFFGSYWDGSTAAQYSPGSYKYLDQVRYQKKIYSSLINDNTDLPTTSNWLLIQDNFIGLNERSKYNGQRIVLEYALNKEFDSTFRQPQTPSGIGDTRSDIYITNLSSSVVGFLVGETTGSAVGQTTSDDKVGNNNTFIYLNNFQINIPIAIFATTNEPGIRNFVNQYIPSGINYLIVTY